MATAHDYLVRIRDGYLRELAEETENSIATGSPKPTYSLDGKTFQINEWREKMAAKIKELNDLINAAKPWIVTSRGRS